ncbi:tripartite tricarboxylate transporter substrate binding protein [Fusobacterium necrophorum]|nr:tripartite tricarboxylate transporter substrate binding protein [Fusobacterium necrophorum]
MKKILLLIFLLFSLLSFGKNYPEKNINFIVPFSAGGGTDAVARKLVSIMEKDLGKTIVIINKTGGAGAVGMTYGAKSKKDGYTLTMVTREIISLPIMKLSPITYKDFELVSLVNLDPAVVLVEKDSKYKKFEDLIQDAKKNPEKIKFASTAKPNFYILAIEKEMGVKFNHIPYNGAGEVIPALLGKHADFTLVGPGEAMGQIKSGQFRVLGIMADERIESLKGVKTLKELGHNITSGTWRGVAVPKDTPKEIIDILNQSIEKAVESQEFIEFMNKANYGIKYLAPKEFEEFLIEDTKTIEKILN